MNERLSVAANLLLFLPPQPPPPFLDLNLPDWHTQEDQSRLTKPPPWPSFWNASLRNQMGYLPLIPNLSNWLLKMPKTLLEQAMLQILKEESSM